MTAAVIVSTARTPLTKSWKGALNMTHGATMGGHAVEHAILRAGIEAGEVDDVIMGCGTPEGATGAPIEYSVAGQIGHALAVVFEPIGFNWQISVALVPGMAAREVAVSALGTVYALSATGSDTAEALTPLIAHSWSLATALSLLAWFVFAPQCLSTLATVKRETGGWTMPLAMAGYLFALAYGASFVTYRVALWLGG